MPKTNDTVRFYLSIYHHKYRFSLSYIVSHSQPISEYVSELNSSVLPAFTKKDIEQKIVTNERMNNVRRWTNRLDGKNSDLD